MFDERPELSAKWRISWNMFQGLVNAKGLVTWLRNYKLLYFQSFIEIAVMSDERPKLSRKWGDFLKPF